ncbi:hypothetical protein MNBD_PLANCTO03-1687 [hydrothermal vent metagenome]|uniref:FUN14 family protein n=1 Tax=hydrothermal vent metagenome TaxID=652676 RepID=A0A3B1E270_9ZZZZ
MSEQAAANSGFLAGLTVVQKLALVVAAVVSFTGAGMWGVAATTAPDRTVPADKTAATEGDDAPAYRPEGLTDDTTAGSPDDGDEPREAGDDADQDKTTLELYSPTVFRLGFAFFVGFAIAYALRAAFKVVLIVVGAVLLLLVGLQMAGLITVNWEAMQGLYETSTAWLATQTESLTAFLRGYIPSGGTAVAGFGVGMLKGK